MAGTKAPAADQHGLTPHGVSGLKFVESRNRTANLESHPTRGEWIEMLITTPTWRGANSLTPHGVSGLKSVQYQSSHDLIESHPTRGEWIEISS